MIFPALRAVTSLQDKLALIERRDIDGANLQFPEHLSFLSEFEFHRLRGKTQLLNQNNQERIDNMPLSLLIGLYASQNPFCYIIDAYPDHIEIYIGSKDSQSGGSSIYRKILEGYWGPEYILKDRNIIDRIKDLYNRPVCGTITGIPNTAPVAPSVRKIIPSDQWIKSLQGERWTYLVNGFCIPRVTLSEYESLLISEIALLKTCIIREDVLYEEKRLAEHLLGFLEANLKRIEQSRLTGAWQVGVYFFADRELLIRQGMGLLSSHFGNKRSEIQPIRTHLCYKKNELKPSFSNLLTSTESSILISLPEEEVPGYLIRRVAQFDTDSLNMRPMTPIIIGQILRNWAVTDNTYTIEMSDLTRHGLIAGVTGSGKTTTCFNIIRQLKQKGIPFLVIESAKSEYRQLLNDSLFHDMLVFTLGDEVPESSAPFRINPFEVPAGILVQTHLDFLKSLFRASFVMYAPMPYVLEEALHEVYRDKGWNLSANTNDRGINNRAFPTLTDLYEKIDEVVFRLGYDERISKDILAGLKTRINNLRLGGKGLMLDTNQSVSIDMLMNKPVLLELKKIGNDDEKAFLIGIILTRIYEYFEIARESNLTINKFKHLTLIEEAHRLLKHVSEETSEIEGNARSKAVEVFCNMLSEIRSYGGGVFVSEQIPSKLARDVLKNTNLKIMHRIVAKDDRDIMGDTMNLAEEQKKYATTLEQGRAIVFAEGMDSPFLIYVPIKNVSDKKIMERPITNQYIYQHMKKNFYTLNEWTLLKYPECKYCSVDKNRCESIREAIKWILSGQKGREIFNRLFLTAALAEPVLETLRDIDRVIYEKVPVKDKQDINNIRLCYIAQAANQSIEEQGRLYGYPYDDIKDILSSFIQGMIPFVANGGIDKKQFEIFQELFTKLRTKFEAPFIGCFICNKICLYRFEASHFLKDKRVNEDFDYLTTKVEDDNNMWIELSRICKKVANGLIHSDDSVILKGLALCYLSQKVSHADYPPKIQEKVIKNVKSVFEHGE